MRIFSLDSRRFDDRGVAGASLAGRRIRMQGTVQGVGFRPWVYRVAQAAAVTGRVRNDTAGVTIEAFGPAGALDAFVERLAHDAARPAAAVVDRDRGRADRVRGGATGSRSCQSAASADPRVSIPPDLATCADCLAEIHDPANRRYRYPFTNCTNCGPRFTIVRSAPYDRPATTMAAFAMCAICQREYDMVEDRRFHAQPNACPACGPRLDLRGADGASASRRRIRSPRRRARCATDGSSPSRASAGSSWRATRPRKRPCGACASGSTATRSRSR